VREVLLHNQLIEKCRKGDKNAQFRIYELYYKAIYNTCFRLVRNHQVAEEIMQDTFLAAFEKIEQFLGIVAFGAWLKKIAVNKSLDKIKGQKIVFSDLQLNEHQPIDVIDNEFDPQYSAETLQIIRQAIEIMPEGYRIILSLYLIEGYDHDEIAELLQIKPASSRSQLARAKKYLIEQLQLQNYFYSHGKLKKTNSE